MATDTVIHSSPIRSDHTAKARICMPTLRKFKRKTFECGMYEAQDVLAEIDAVDLIHLEPAAGYITNETLQKWRRTILYKDPTKSLVFRNPGLKKVRLDKEYDLFVAVCQNYWDLLCLNAIEGWRDQCKTAVVWIDEFWAQAVSYYGHWLHALSKFDHIFLSFRGTLEPLSKAIGRNCTWLPGAVDAVRFNPFPNPPQRVIDVASIGRRWEPVHQGLLKAAARKELFYFYDTFARAADMEPYDHRQHRQLFASLGGRSRYFMVAPAKMDASDQTAGQLEVGHRYFEGAATGAVLIGQPVHCEAFRELFSWPDAVVPINPDGSDVLQVVAALNSQPDRWQAISRRNMVETLLHHDWVHRWMLLLETAGVEPSPGLLLREGHLRSLAEIVAGA